MRQYYIIPLSDFNDEMLIEHYNVVTTSGKFKIVIATDGQGVPDGEGWHIFDGEHSNRNCAKFLDKNSAE